MIPFPDKKYSIIYADPPWSYSDSGCSGAAAAQYATMSINELKQLPVNPAGGGIAADNCVLFMWATYPKMQEALDLIELRSLCIPNEGTAYLLDLLSRMTNENSVSTNDNGVTQTVEARQGVALNAVVEIKPRVMLRPFRTFLEVEQPESEFLLRVDPDEGIGFFEADGGIWKLEAKKNIADYFLKNMGDLIDAGKVVVMQ